MARTSKFAKAQFRLTLYVIINLWFAVLIIISPCDLVFKIIVAALLIIFFIYLDNKISKWNTK